MCWMAFTIEGKIACVRFPSWLSVAFGNALVFVLHGAFVHGSMYSLAMDLIHSAMLFLAMHLWMCYRKASMC
jgi:hypothetical protein